MFKRFRPREVSVLVDYILYHLQVWRLFSIAPFARTIWSLAKVCKHDVDAISLALGTVSRFCLLFSLCTNWLYFGSCVVLINHEFASSLILLSTEFWAFFSISFCWVRFYFIISYSLSLTCVIGSTFRLCLYLNSIIFIWAPSAPCFIFIENMPNFRDTNCQWWGQNFRRRSLPASNGRLSRTRTQHFLRVHLPHSREITLWRSYHVQSSAPGENRSLLGSASIFSMTLNHFLYFPIKINICVSIWWVFYFITPAFTTFVLDKITSREVDYFEGMD